MKHIETGGAEIMPELTPDEITEAINDPEFNNDPELNMDEIELSVEPEKEKERNSEIERGNELRKRLSEVFGVIDSELYAYGVDSNKKIESMREEGELLLTRIKEMSRRLRLGQNENISSFENNLISLIKKLEEEIKKEFFNNGEKPNVAAYFSLKKIEKVLEVWQDKNNITKIDVTDAERDSGLALLGKMPADEMGRKSEIGNIDVTKGGARLLPDANALYYNCRSAVGVPLEQWREISRHANIDDEDKYFRRVGIIFAIFKPGYIIPKQEYTSEKRTMDNSYDEGKSFIVKTETFNFVPERKK